MYISNIIIYSVNFPAKSEKLYWWVIRSPVDVDKCSPSNDIQADDENLGDYEYIKNLHLYNIYIYIGIYI